MTTRCRGCALPFEPTPHQVKTYDYICKPCRRQNEKAWRERRKVAGRPVKSGQMPREYHVAYATDYSRRPDVRQRRAAHARQRNSNPAEAPKIAARIAVRRAIESGRLVKRPCFCGNAKVDAHHDDYSRPLEVKWLCRRHHAELHRAKAEGRS